MDILSMPPNPFKTPVYYRDTVDSTMDEARTLAAEGAEHGTVIAADYQRTGRGRSGRPWQTVRGESLSFTVILRYMVVPSCLTLKTGLAASFAVEDFVRSLGAAVPENAVLVKWPNDIMLVQNGGGKKTAGILAEGSLTEASGGTVYLGIGINIAQRSFPPELADKACSIAAFFGIDPQTAAEKRFALMEMILARLREEPDNPHWREGLEGRLFMKGRPVRFVPGAPAEKAAGGTSSPVEGILRGIGEDGEILIDSRGHTLSFVTGELVYFRDVLS